MDWLFFSLAGASSLAVTGVLDKFLLGKYVRNPQAYLVALIILQQIFALGIFLFAGPGFTYPHSLYAMGTGGLQVALWTSYLRALQIEETSRVAALAYVFPVFVFLGSFLFLGEILTPKDYAGGFLLVLSSLLISYRPALPGGRVIFSPALKYMVSFWIFTAAYAVASKYLLAFMDEWHLIMWSSLGSLLVVLPLLALEEIRREAFRYYRSGTFLFSALLADELFDFLGRASFEGFDLVSVNSSLNSRVNIFNPYSRSWT